MLACAHGLSCLVAVALLQSPLTLLQKVKLLVASYPFWPDYTLLQCLNEGPSTGQARLQQPAATAAAVAGQS